MGDQHLSARAARFRAVLLAAVTAAAAAGVFAYVGYAWHGRTPGLGVLLFFLFVFAGNYWMARNRR